MDAGELLALLADPSVPSAAEEARQALEETPRLRATVAGLETTRDELAAQLAEALKRPAPTFGEYKPTAATTGATNRPRKIHRGSIELKNDGMVIKDLDVYGRIYGNVPTAEIDNVVVHGVENPSAKTGAGVGLIQCTDKAVAGWKITDVTLQPDVPHWSLVGILGHHFHSRRVRMTNVGDGFGIYNVHDPHGPLNVLDEGSWVSSLAYFRPSDNGTRAEGTHNDPVQIQGGSGMRFVGSRLDCFLTPGIGQAESNTHAPWMTGNACVMISPNVGRVADVVFDRPWFHGGAVSINVVEQGRGPVRGLKLLSPRFGRDQLIPPGKKTPVQGLIVRTSYDESTFTDVQFEDGVGTPKLQRV